MLDHNGDLAKTYGGRNSGNVGIDGGVKGSRKTGDSEGCGIVWVRQKRWMQNAGANISGITSLVIYRATAIPCIHKVPMIMI